MNGKQAKRTKKMCQFIWVKVPAVQILYEHNFRKFYRQAKKDVVAGSTAMLSRLYANALTNVTNAEHTKVSMSGTAVTNE